MKNFVFYILILICLFLPLRAEGSTLISFRDVWNYKFVTELNEDNWGNTHWNNVNYNTFNWNNTIWQTGNAPFGDWNWYETYSTYWNTSNDLALRKIININGQLSHLNFISNVDDRFALFVNGHQLIKTIDGGAFTYQYNDLDASYFVQGNNYIDILVDDVRKIDWFDMQLTADITDSSTPTPEPSVMLLGLLGLGSLFGLTRRFDINLS